MALTIVDPELFGVTEESCTVTFAVHDASGPVDAPARVLVDGVPRATSAGVRGTRLVRVEGLTPATRHRIDVVAGGGARAEPDRFFPGVVDTLPACDARPVASFATLNDLHFGEERFGGVLLADGSYGDEAPGHPVAHESDGDVPYWRAMNEDAIADINAAGVDFVVIKGDIADRGRREQFAAARETFARFATPWHALLGNHDHYALLEGDEVDGYELLGEPRAPRTIDVAGWRLVLVDTVEPGAHHGVFPDERLRWLESELEDARERRLPTLVFMHHQPVPPEFADRFPNTIGIVPAHSTRMFELFGRHPQVRAVLIGHTHQNRVRRHPRAGTVPFVEVSCVKDYPGSFAHYRLYEDGSLRQEVRRIGSARALAHSTRCRDFFAGGYRRFALGSLADRSFVVDGRG
ncbi:MAG: metallophosphoesterase [Thermodesulfobacteriota bacterium]